MKIDKTYNNEFEKQLKEAGYKWFKDNWNKALRGFQKKFIDEKGIKYFITGYHYNFAKQGYDNISESEYQKDRYHFNCQFDLEGNKENIVDLHFSGDFLPNQWRPVTTLKDVEKFYETFWETMNCKYYELYY